MPLCALPAKPGGPAPVGQEELRRLVREAAQGQMLELGVRVAMNESRLIHLLENRGQVLEREYDGETVTLKMKIGRRQLDIIRTGGSGRMSFVSTGTPVPPDLLPKPPKSQVGWTAPAR